MVELQELHPCLLSRDTGRSQHAPPSGLTTTQRPSDGVQESEREDRIQGVEKNQVVERERKETNKTERILVSATQWSYP